MEGWKELVLSLPGLPEGVTEINTTVATDFFTQFENSPIDRASYDVQVLFDKKPGLYILDVNAKGWHEANCDRCLERIMIPDEASYQYFFNKESTAGDAEDGDVFTLEEGAVELDLRPLVYESIVLSLPMINVYDCGEDDQAPCDKKVLDILRDKENDESESTNPTWDVLKNINFEE